MDSGRGLTAAETVAIQAFRERIDDILPRLNKHLSHDLGLVRFLRARELNLDKAEDMLRKHMQWKEDNGLQNILQSQVAPEIEEDYRFHLSGFSKKGCIVFTCHIGGWDLKKTSGPEKKEAFMHFVRKVFEFAMALCAKVSTPDKYVTQFHAILDFEGFSFSQLVSKDVIEIICDSLRIFEANYPEILGCCSVINAPKLFQVLWAIVKPMLTARTLDKINIYGSNKDVWKKVLLNDIHPDNLLSTMGGSLTSTTPFSFKQGFDVFPKAIDHSEEEMKTRFIQAGQKFGLELYLKSGSKLSWNFKSDNDINFQVDCDGCQSVVAKHRVDSQVFTQKGFIFCEESGNYTLTFDNSFSTFRGKTLKYVVQTYDKSEDINGNNFNRIS